MSENLGRIRAVRAGNRGVITKLIKEAEFHINQLNESPQGKYDIGRMKTICSILSEKKDILKTLDEKIVSLCEVEEIAKEIEEADEYMSRILDTQRILKESESKPVDIETKTKDQVSQVLPPSTSEELTGTVNLIDLQGSNASMNASVSANTNDTNILKRDRRCFPCLGKNHRSSQCDPKRNCQKCGNKHHQSICDKMRQPFTPSPPQNEDTPPLPREPISEEKSQTATVTTTATKTRPQVLLQTAVTYAESPNGSNSIPVRVLFDNGRTSRTR